MGAGDEGEMEEVGARGRPRSRDPHRPEVRSYKEGDYDDVRDEMAFHNHFTGDVVGNCSDLGDEGEGRSQVWASEGLRRHRRSQDSNGYSCSVEG